MNLNNLISVFELQSEGHFCLHLGTSRNPSFSPISHTCEPHY